jgi:hypothetical protein
MKIEVVFQKRRKGRSNVEVFEHMENGNQCVTRLVASGHSPQHHAFANNVIDAAKMYGIECVVDG